MARSNTNPRTLAALILLGAMIAVFAALGNWQLHRAAQRQSIKQAILDGRSSPPLQLNTATPHNELTNWRPAIVNGTWLDKFTVLLENRNFKGQPGFWVATPLLIEPGTNTAILILRGWLPRTMDSGNKTPVIPAPRNGLAIQGELLDRVPRLFELWSFGGRAEGALPRKLPDAAGEVPKVQNLDLAAYASASGLTLLPSVLEQTSDSGDHLGRQWPEPSIDIDRNKGYALQWFSFAGIAAIAWLGIAWRALRPHKLSA